MWEEKVWGRTRPTFIRDQYELHELVVRAGGYCSVHYHAVKANRFFVKSGIISVVEFRAWEVTRTILRAGETYDVPSRVVHRFEVFESGVVHEAYWPDSPLVDRHSIANDIERLSRGGFVDLTGLSVDKEFDLFDKTIEAAAIKAGNA